MALITGYWWLGLLEAAAHAWIDDEKCSGRLTFGEDQALHLFFKGVWFAVWLLLAPNPLT